MENIQIFDQGGNLIGAASKFRWAQFRELRGETMRYENFITGRIWPKSPLTVPGPYIVFVRFLIPELNKHSTQYFVGLDLDYNDTSDEGGIAFKARVLSLVPPLGYNLNIEEE